MIFWNKGQSALSVVRPTEDSQLISTLLDLDSTQVLQLLEPPSDTFGVFIGADSRDDIGTLKPVYKKKSGTFEPIDIYDQFVKLGATPTNALTGTMMAGRESNFSGIAYNKESGASGLFQGMKQWWPMATVSASFKDHIPMMEKMMEVYHMDGEDMSFSAMYASHFIDTHARCLKTGHRFVARPSVVAKKSGKEIGNWFGQYCVVDPTGNLVTDILYSGLANIAWGSQFLNGCRIRFVAGGGQDRKVAYFAKGKDSAYQTFHLEGPVHAATSKELTAAGGKHILKGTSTIQASSTVKPSSKNEKRSLPRNGKIVSYKITNDK